MARGSNAAAWPRDATSELNFHIWNANSQSFARAKNEAKMAAHGGKFWTSVSVLFAVLHVSSSPLHDFNFQLLFGSSSKTFTTTEKVKRRNITEPVLHIRLKRFVIIVWPKNCPKLCKDDKLTVKKDVHLVVSSSNFSGPFYQVSRQFSNLFSWKYNL